MSNSLKHIYGKIQSIAAEPSTNAKIELLKGFMQDRTFRRVLYGAYAEHLSFGIATFPTIERARSVKGLLERLTGDEDILDMLKKFAAQDGVSMADKDRLFKAAAVDKETLLLTQMICKKDLCCGISAITINKAWPGFIGITPYQRCSTSKDIDNISFDPEAIAQIKANGTFAYFHVNQKKFKSRSGSTFQQMEHLIAGLMVRPKKMKFGTPYGIKNHTSTKDRNDVLVGELRVYDEEGNVMGRQEGNGIITSCIYGTANPEDAKRVFYTVWDCITADEYEAMQSDIAYNTRFYHASLYVNAVNDPLYVNAVNDPRYLQLIETRRVKSIAEVREYYKDARLRDEEGIVVKNLSGKWRNNTSKDYIKMKPVIEADMIIYGFTPHSKNPKLLGALKLMSREGKVLCSCGSGFTQKQREADWSIYKGRIATVEAEGVVKSKTKKGKYSLYTPTFIELRHDKKIANSLQELLDIQRESKRGSRKRG